RRRARGRDAPSHGVSPRGRVLSDALAAAGSRRLRGRAAPAPRDRCLHDSGRYLRRVVPERAPDQLRHVARPHRNGVRENDPMVRETIILTRRDVAEEIDIRAAIPAIEACFAEFEKGGDLLPPKYIVSMPLGIAACIAGYTRATNLLSMKLGQER